MEPSIPGLRQYVLVGNQWLLIVALLCQVLARALPSWSNKATVFPLISVCDRLVYFSLIVVVACVGTTNSSLITQRTLFTPKMEARRAARLCRDQVADGDATDGGLFSRPGMRQLVPPNVDGVCSWSAGTHQVRRDLLPSCPGCFREAAHKRFHACLRPVHYLCFLFCNLLPTSPAFLLVLARPHYVDEMCSWCCAIQSFQDGMFMRAGRRCRRIVMARSSCYYMLPVFVLSSFPVVVWPFLSSCSHCHRSVLSSTSRD